MGRNGTPAASARQAACGELHPAPARQFAPGGLLHYGQGKWYPGEPLPRWAFAVYWRADRQPLWENVKHIDSEIPAKPVTQADAGTFAATLAGQLGLPADSAMPAYEDPAHFLLIEQKLPLNVDPATNKLEDPQERARVIRVFERGLDKPAGYVMPIQVWHSQARGRSWVTERWGFRRERLFLLPGDSPVGFRLPIRSLPSLRAVQLLACRSDRSFRRPCRLAAARGVAARPQAVGHADFASRLYGRSSTRGVWLGSHRDGDRGARRAFVRVHAAAFRRGGLCRPRRRHRGDVKITAGARPYRRRSPARLSAVSTSSRLCPTPASLKWHPSGERLG